ncbi:MAG: PASTA domain-containing protein [Coriobacteriia bacterium]|nr:PASTA domain-containing protein [Coriobacteriia bacterium]
MLLAGVTIGLVLWSARLATVRVPAVVGLDRTAAATRLQEFGLTMRVGDRRFSDTVPPGEIVDQSPAPGSKVQEGSQVVVAVSAGTENFPMPDVTGMALDKARSVLRDRGLSVEVLTVASDRPQGTVVETFPSPGVTVATGTQVRINVAAGNGTGATLLPTDLTGKTFMLDPEPMPATGVADTSMDVARRLRALLEASGAKVMVTREVTDSGEKAGTLSRARRAKETSSTALIGFTVTQSGSAGLVVMSLPATGTTQPFYLVSASLAAALTDAIRAAGRPVTTSVAAADLILTGTGVPAVRLRLGSLGAPDDKLMFTDPQWADDVARAVYRAIGSVYGSK